MQKAGVFHRSGIIKDIIRGNISTSKTVFFVAFMPKKHCFWGFMHKKRSFFAYIGMNFVKMVDFSIILGYNENCGGTLRINISQCKRGVLHTII